MSVSFIAEVSSNHNQDLERCLRLVDVAADVGCQAVKFQLFRVEDLFHPRAVETSPDVREREDWELPLSFLPEIADRCEEHGVEFGCSPFSMDAVERLRPHVTFYKVASYELLWDDLLEACASTGKPVVLSTGMADMAEIGHAVETLADAGCEDLTLLHCVSSYPVAPSQCNLAAIATLRDTFDTPVGWSDHSVDPGVIHRAVHRWGATTVEFHLDLDDEAGFEADTGHCWTPGEVRPVLDAVWSGFEADGDPAKRPVEAEAEERDWRTNPVDGFRPLPSVRETWEE